MRGGLRRVQFSAFFHTIVCRIITLVKNYKSIWNTEKRYGVFNVFQMAQVYIMYWKMVVALLPTNWITSFQKFFNSIDRIVIIEMYSCSTQS